MTKNNEKEAKLQRYKQDLEMEFDKKVARAEGEKKALMELLHSVDRLEPKVA